MRSSTWSSTGRRSFQKTSNSPKRRLNWSQSDHCVDREAELAPSDEQSSLADAYALLKGGGDYDEG